MIVDTSALLAVLLKESDAPLYANALSKPRELGIGAPTRFELMMVCEGRGGVSMRAEGEAMLRSLSIKAIDFTSEFADAALAAFARYGRGRGSPARLNFGDCMSYAVAKALGRPLLFKGDDFAHTDIAPAL